MVDYSKFQHGKDAEIDDSITNLSASERERNYKWNPRSFSDLPSSKIEFELLQQGSVLRREGYHAPTLEDLKPKVVEVLLPDDDVEDSATSLVESEKELKMKLNVPERDLPGM